MLGFVLDFELAPGHIAEGCTVEILDVVLEEQNYPYSITWP